MALKILLADDSMIAQNLGKKILTDAGHEVVAVSNGAAAVKKLAEVKPQLAILDIYMPGYTGLEVCERMKNSPETAKIPVLLTVGKMEPYRPEDGARVKAEGVIIKPFEGSDLVAAVNKLAEKIAQPKPAPDYEQIDASSPQEIQEFTVASYEEASPETAASAAPAHDMSLPAFGMDELPVAHDPTPPVPLAAVAVAGAAAMALHGISISVAEGHFAVEDIPAVAPIDPFAPVDAQPMEIAAPVEMETAASFKVEPTAAQSVTFDLPATDAMSELEFTGAPPVEVQVEPTADFEPTILQDAIVVEDAFAVDPALVTDVTEMATAFPTKFGTENGEDIPVGVFSEESIPAREPVVDATGEAETLVTELPVSADEAAIMTPPIAEERSEEIAPALSMEALPELEEFDPAMADLMPEPAESAVPETSVVDSEALVEAVPGWQAHEAAVDASEAALSLDEEMQRAFASLEDKLETPLVPVEPPPAESVPEHTFGQEAAAIAPELADVPAHEPEPTMEATLASLDSQDMPETLVEVPAFEELQAITPEAVSTPEPAIETAPVDLPSPVQAEPLVEESTPLVGEALDDNAVEAAAAQSCEELLLDSDLVAEADLPAVAELAPELSAIGMISPAELAEPVAATPELEIAPEPAIAEVQPEPLVAIETEVMRRAAVLEPSVAVVSEVVPAQASMDEGRVATAVARVMERMKTQIVAEIVKELQSE